MTAPRPSASFGRWRKQTVNVAGVPITPINVTEQDRTKIDQRLITTDKDNNTSEQR